MSVVEIYFSTLSVYWGDDFAEKYAQKLLGSNFNSRYFEIFYLFIFIFFFQKTGFNISCKLHHENIPI